jgi:hypothetical protein
VYHTLCRILPYVQCGRNVQDTYFDVDMTIVSKQGKISYYNLIKFKKKLTWQMILDDMESHICCRRYDHFSALYVHCRAWHIEDNRALHI